MNLIRQILAHPHTRNLNLDDPDTTRLRREILLKKSFLMNLYAEWYGLLLIKICKKKDVLEIGSGGGFLSNYFPELIRSEIFLIPEIDIVLDATRLPFPDDSLDAIVMTDVFHHISDVRQFLKEADRCIKKNGIITMIEPWNNGWSSWIYRHLHHEPFDENKVWELEKGGPLSTANGALPWIVFERDKELFLNEFSNWVIEEIRPLMPVAYLFSGGISMRSFMPGFFYKTIRFFEQLLFEKKCGMFALIRITKIK